MESTRRPGATRIGGTGGTRIAGAGGTGDDGRTVVSSSYPMQQNSATLPLAAEVAPTEQEAIDKDALIEELLQRVQEAPQNAAVATAQEADTGEATNTARWKYISIALCITILLGVVIGVVVAVTGPSSEVDSPSNDVITTSPSAANKAEFVLSQAPSLNPTSVAPTTYYEYIYSLIAAYSQVAVLEESSTPQSRGLQWVYGDLSTNEIEWTDSEIMERYALSVLFFSTDGSRWLTVNDFLLSLHHCNWDGIECSEDGQGLRIVALNFPFENMVGSLPKEIGLLTTLRSLNFEGNSLTGSIPTEIGFLTDLQDLSLMGRDEERMFLIPKRQRLSHRRSLEDALGMHNNLSGSIPSEMGNMRNLVRLQLHGNSLTSTIPSEIGLLSNVTMLSLHDNELDGEIPLQLGFLSKLEYLSLDRNQLSGTVPISLCSSVSLLQEMSADCSQAEDGSAAQVGCKCCPICCNKSAQCIDVEVTAFPSSSPSTPFPSIFPSPSPSTAPSMLPSSGPTTSPSQNPSLLPSTAPSVHPSPEPSPSGTPEPTDTHSSTPTGLPSSEPSPSPTSKPSVESSSAPSGAPTPTLPPSSSCSIHADSCSGNRACNDVFELCTEGGSCTGRNACRSASGLAVGLDSCVGKL